MVYDEELADRIRFMVGSGVATETRMFGGLAFLVGGNMSVSASREGGLLVRVDPDRTEQLLAEPGAYEFEMRGRTMRGWLRVSAEVLDDDATLRAWVDRAVSYARSLPAKAKPARS